MAKGWMSKDPSEMTARQQRRMQFMEKRGRSGRVQGQPTEMPEMTARQQRRQQFLERKQARQDRRVEDWRAQQQGANVGNAVAQLPTDLGGGFAGRLADFANKPGSQGENPFGGYRRLSDQELFERGYDPRNPNFVSVGPDGKEITTLMGFNNTPLSAEESQRLWQERLRNNQAQGLPTTTYWPGAQPPTSMDLRFNPSQEELNSLPSLAGAFGAPMPQQPTYMDPRFAEANQRQTKGWGARYMNPQYPGATNGGFAMPPRPGQG